MVRAKARNQPVEAGNHILEISAAGVESVNAGGVQNALREQTIQQG
jgi:hypothetical protein